MNSKDKHPDYKKLYSIACKIYNKTNHFDNGPHDEVYFSMRVYEMCKEIIKKSKLRVKKEQILVAAILHDIGKSKMKVSKIFGKGIMKRDTVKEEWDKHPELGVPMIRRILKKEGHSQDFIEEVIEIARHHANRGDKLKRRSNEIKILQDADLIADWGIEGFVRHFLFAGKFRRSAGGAIYGIKHISTKDKEMKRRQIELINLPISKKIAKKKIKRESELIDELRATLKSNLLQ